MKRESTRGWWSALLAIGMAFCGTCSQAADKVINIRLSTLAPRGTSYHRSLLQMGEQWREASKGAVKLTVFPDGTQGGEADMVGLMQTGNLDAGLLTAVGLSEIDRAVHALQSMPMTFRTLDEVEYVGAKLSPMLQERLLKKGYVVLFWSDSGWVRFFSKTPILHPDDLRKLKLFSWAGNAREQDIWRAARFHPVPLETAGIPQGLLSDTIDAVPMPPFFALAGQLHTQTKYMLDLHWGALVGAAVVRQKSWERIPPELRDELLKIAARTGSLIRADGRKEGEDAIVAMAKRGLVVQQVSPEVRAEWQAAVDEIKDMIRGRIVPEDMYDEAQRLLREYRAGAGGTPK